VRLGGLDWLVMSRKLQICASPCLDQVLHQIQWSQHLATMCSTVTQPSCPAGIMSASHHKQVLQKSLRLSVCLSACSSNAKTESCKQVDRPDPRAICQALLASCWTVHCSVRHQLWCCKAPVGQSLQQPTMTHFLMPASATHPLTGTSTYL